jgi:hypothetical protein
MSESGQRKPVPVWCVVANVREETPGGEGDRETRRGSKHFQPGAKVYCFPPLWGDGYQNVKVVGRHRGSHRYVTMVIDSQYLTNWRVELVYGPYVTREMKGYWDGTRKSRKLTVRQNRLCSSPGWNGKGDRHRLAPDRNGAELPPDSPFRLHVPAPAGRASPLAGILVNHNPPFPILRSHITVAADAKRMVQQTRGHVGLSRLKNSSHTPSVEPTDQPFSRARYALAG